MANLKIGAEVWSGLGITPWTTRADFSFNQSQTSLNTDSIEVDSSSAELDKHDNMNTSPRWVIIGAGLNTIWQQADNQAWLLWKAITQFHFASLDAITFYDTDLIVGEQALFDVVEQIIELDVEWVYSMDSTHELHHQLAEGVSVITLPSFEDMLAQPLLKRETYQRLKQPELYLAGNEF